MPYCKLFYHMVWVTKSREPLLTPQVEPLAYDFLRSKASGLGAVVYALSGMLDHVHLVVSLPPTIAVSTFVGQVKAVASTKINKSNVTPQPFSWQDEYGAFSFEAQRLRHYVDYVTRQKEHHAKRKLIPALERTRNKE